MLLNAYSLYDRKALVYHPPFYASTHGVAVRSVQDLVSDPNTQVARHPADFVLFHVGFFNDSKGELSPVSPLAHITDAAALVPPRTADLFKQGEGE